jgi:hypothetical protein
MGRLPSLAALAGPRITEPREVDEASAQRITQPPAPDFETLRDSCRSLRIVELALEEIDVGWGDAEAKR